MRMAQKKGKTKVTKRQRSQRKGGDGATEKDKEEGKKECKRKTRQVIENGQKEPKNGKEKAK